MANYYYNYKDSYYQYLAGQFEIDQAHGRQQVDGQFVRHPTRITNATWPNRIWWI